MALTMYLFGCASLACLAYAAYPLLATNAAMLSEKIGRYQVAKADKAAKVFDDMFVEVTPMWVTIVYRVAPLAGALVLYLIFNYLIVAAIGLVLGFIIPDMYVKHINARRRKKFQGQLVDVLFMLSSSLRAGLSLTQAFETLETEMGPPASQEFGLMMRAHRVGLSLEESMQGLNKRMACEDLQLITTAVILARATGGDVTKIISQLITTIREKKKIDEKVETLTLQGKLQAYMMSGLPVAFAFFVRIFNPHYFDMLLTDPLGHKLIMAAVGLWITGILVLLKMSKVEF